MPTQNPLRSSRNKPLEWLYFFIADVETGLGPFLAAFLSASEWNPGYVGYALTFQGLTTVAFQTPAGPVIDSSRRKRLLIFVNLMVSAIGALLLAARPSSPAVFSSAFLIDLPGAFLGPTLAAITLGLVGGDKFDAQFFGTRDSIPRAMSFARYGSVSLGIASAIAQCFWSPSPLPSPAYWR